jgi:hypothetical protein
LPWNQHRSDLHWNKNRDAIYDEAVQEHYSLWDLQCGKRKRRENTALSINSVRYSARLNVDSPVLPSNKMMDDHYIIVNINAMMMSIPGQLQ